RRPAPTSLTVRPEPSASVRIAGTTTPGWRSGRQPPKRPQTLHTNSGLPSRAPDRGSRDKNVLRSPTQRRGSPTRPWHAVFRQSADRAPRDTAKQLPRRSARSAYRCCRHALEKKRHERSGYEGNHSSSLCCCSEPPVTSLTRIAVVLRCNWHCTRCGFLSACAGALPNPLHPWQAAEKAFFFRRPGFWPRKKVFAKFFSRLFEVTKVLFLRAGPKILRKLVKLCQELGDHSFRQ